MTAEYVRNGKAHVGSSLPAFNKAAKHSLWLVLRDLDHDAECAVALAKLLLPRPSANMRLRIAVRAIESWLLADAEGFSRYFSVAPHHIPVVPEALDDPKKALMDAVTRSRSRAIREDVLPARETSARVGPGYVVRLGEFAGGYWNWKRAMRRSDSLRRCVQALDTLA